MFGKQILSTALHASLEEQCPLLGEIVDIAVNSVYPWSKLREMAPIFFISTDCGRVSRPDLALVSAIEPLQETGIFELLPAAFAALLTAPQWSDVSYFPALEAFGGNEHCLIIALASMIECFVSSSQENPDETFRNIQTLSSKFLEIASHVIVMLRIFESDDQNKSKPLRPMVFLLELFVSISPTLNRGDLERYFPYALLHDSQVDIAMGKQCFTDHITMGLDVEPKSG